MQLKLQKNVPQGELKVSKMQLPADKFKYGNGQRQRRQLCSAYQLISVEITRRGRSLRSLRAAATCVFPPPRAIQSVVSRSSTRRHPPFRIRMQWVVTAAVQFAYQMDFYRLFRKRRKRLPSALDRSLKYIAGRRATATVPVFRRSGGTVSLAMEATRGLRRRCWIASTRKLIRPPASLLPLSVDRKSNSFQLNSIRTWFNWRKSPFNWDISGTNRSIPEFKFLQFWVKSSTLSLKMILMHLHKHLQRIELIRKEFRSYERPLLFRNWINLIDLKLTLL